MPEVRPFAETAFFVGPSQANHTFRKALLIVLALCWAVAGCRKSEPERPTPARIHSITRELADAARSVAPAEAQVRTLLQTSDKNPKATDQLDITLFSEGPDSSNRSVTTNIEQSLGAVATRKGLTQQPLQCREGICFQYLESGVPTNLIHIHWRTKSAQRSAAEQSSVPKLAIILDDLGGDRAAAEAVFKLPYPLTLSVLPNHEHSTEIAHEALRRGYQVMLHLPMQAVANETPETQELRPGMPAAQVSSLVDQFLQSVPGAAGVNNHQGSQATSDPALMEELMPILREHQLFYIDSRTTAATVAYDTAESFGVPSAFRNVPFLDDVAEAGAVRKQLALALRGARDKGDAVAIGHPRPATLQALREVLPNVQTQGVHLAFVSEFVH